MRRSTEGMRRLCAVVLAVMTVSSCSGSTHSPHPSAPPPVTIRTNINGEFYFTPRPAPPAATSLTAARAWAVEAAGNPIPTSVTSQYGLLVDKVSLPGQRAWRFRDRAVWAFSSRGQCQAPGSNGIGGTPKPPVPCVEWQFVHASTGKGIVITEQIVKPPGG